jgi:hypothetical protein
MSFEIASRFVWATFTLTCQTLKTKATDDSVPKGLQKELAEAKQTLIDGTETLRRVETKIADLNRNKQSDDLDGTDFSWRVLGLRDEGIAARVIQDANEANRTKYRGAMKVTAVRAGSTTESKAIHLGDLLLVIDGMQTATVSLSTQNRRPKDA